MPKKSKSDGDKVFLKFSNTFPAAWKRQLGQAWTEADGNGPLSQIDFALNHGSRMQFGKTAPKSYLDPKVWPTWKGQAEDGTSKFVGDWIPLENSGKCSLGVHFPAKRSDFARNVD